MEEGVEAVIFGSGCGAKGSGCWNVWSGVGEEFGCWAGEGIYHLIREVKKRGIGVEEVEKRE